MKVDAACIERWRKLAQQAANGYAGAAQQLERDLFQAWLDVTRDEVEAHLARPEQTRSPPRHKGGMRFEVKVPNDDEGESLGDYEADTLPRPGERFAIYGNPLVCLHEHDYFIGVVDEVMWEATPGKAVPTVWLREGESAKVTVYCTCTTEERTRHQNVDDEDGRCGNCAKAVRQ